MRLEALTNMKTKPVKQAADVLLYLGRCKDAIKNIPAPAGISISFNVSAEGAKAQKIVSIAREMLDSVHKQLAQLDLAVDRASRKVEPCTSTHSATVRSASKSSVKATKTR